MEKKNSVSQEKGESIDDSPERIEMLELSGKKNLSSYYNHAQ